MNLTKPQRRALEILRDHGPFASVTAFAECMWPPSDPRYAASWSRVHNCGPYGSTTGAPMWMNGGRLLSTLRRLRLAENEPRRQWRITSEGHHELGPDTRPKLNVWLGGRVHIGVPPSLNSWCGASYADSIHHTIPGEWLDGGLKRIRLSETRLATLCQRCRRSAEASGWEFIA